MALNLKTDELLARQDRSHPNGNARDKGIVMHVSPFLWIILSLLTISWSQPTMLKAASIDTVQSAHSSGVLIIKPEETPITKTLRFEQPGTLIVRVVQQPGIDYHLNGELIKFPNPLRWQILAIRAGDTLSFTSQTQGEWLQYFFNSYTAWMIMLFCTVASILSIFINSVQFFMQYRSKVDDAYIRIAIDFAISASILALNTLGLLFVPMQIITFFVSSTFMHSLLLPVSLLTHARIFKVTGLFALFYLAFTLTFGPYPPLKEAVITWNKAIGFLGMVGVGIYFLVFIGMKMGLLKKRNIDYSYVTLMAFTNLMTMYFYFYRQEYLLLTTAPYSLYFAHRSIRSLVDSEKNKTRAEQMAREVEAQNRILEAKNSEVLDLNQNLEHKVAEKTRDIQSLLDHLPQGVLSVDRHLKIRPEYSKVLPSLLETNKIVGENIKDLLIDKSENLTADEKDQFFQAICTMAGESTLNFELNSDLLPKLLKYRNKWLRCTYSTEGQELGLVDKITITLLDVSKEIKNEEVAKAHEEHMAIVTELVNVSAQKSIEFFDSTQSLFEKVSLTLDNPLRLKDFKEILVALHTVKGAARTYYFKALTSEIHKAEQTYSDIIKGSLDPSVVRLKQEFQAVLNCFATYSDINRNQLGRKTELGKIPIDRTFLAKTYRIVTQSLTCIDSKSSLFEEILAHKEAILKLALYNAQTVISEALSSAPSIAKQLNKQPPRIDISGPEIYLDAHQRRTLQLAFLHLLRNSMDHGIESTEERRAKLKSTNGTLFIQIEKLSSQNFQISFADDGRGLALADIKQKCLAKKLCAPMAPPEEIAQVIFHSGFSTAESVSDISGRGVGMDAVRQLFAEIGGEVSIRLGPPKDSQARYFDFQIVILLPISETIDWPLQQTSLAA